MQELGPESHDVVLIQQLEHRWQVHYEDGESAFVSLVGDGGRVELMARVGLLPQTPTPHLLESLLAFNLLGNESGGTRAALQVEERAICLLRDQELAPLSLGGLRDALRSLVALACSWRPLISASAQEAPPLFNPKESP